MNHNNIRFYKFNKNAIIPSKAHFNDAGYDIWITKYIDSKDGVDFYGTDIAVIPPDGYFTKLYPRSSISKTDYMYTNSVGIVDSGYRGEIKIALRYFGNEKDPKKRFKTLPIKFGQLILMKNNNNMNSEEVFYLDKTERGNKGFGSTDKKL